MDLQKTNYSDVLVTQVLNRIALDTLLQTKWSAMKISLAAADVSSALSQFSDDTNAQFEYNFNLFHNHLAEIADGLQDAT